MEEYSPICYFMTRSRPHITNLIALAAYWVVFAETLLLCARRVSKWQQQSASEAWGGVEMLERVARAALILSLIHI